VLEEQGQFLQYDNACARYNHFVDVYVDKSHGEKYQESGKNCYGFSDIPHPNQIEHI
jgi:hypothetical protein